MSDELVIKGAFYKKACHFDVAAMNLTSNNQRQIKVPNIISFTGDFLCNSALQVAKYYKRMSVGFQISSLYERVTESAPKCLMMKFLYKFGNYLYEVLSKMIK